MAFVRAMFVIYLGAALTGLAIFVTVAALGR